MFASSQTDKARAKQVSEAVEKALDDGTLHQRAAGGGQDPGRHCGRQGSRQRHDERPGRRAARREGRPAGKVIELMPSLERLNKELANEIQEGKLEIRMEPRGLVISLRHSAFFSSGTDAMDQSNLPTMKKLAELIATLPNSIQLEGHTDSIPIHNMRFKSNWELSCARAIAVLETFCGTFQLTRARFSVVGRADTVPIDSNETPQGRARNRRVDVVILNSLKLEPVDAAKTAVR